MNLYKVLDNDGSAFHGGNGAWSLPNGAPGDWMPSIEGDLKPCINGYHLCRPQDLIEWLGPTIYIAEHRGELVEADDKVVVREARLLQKLDAWNEKTARLWAADCAEHVLHLFEKERPDDKRPRQAIEAARQFAYGKIEVAACSAAFSAAWSATEYTARSAAEYAAWSAAESAAEYAAESAARYAARSAARSAAWSATRYAAESAWQTQRLFVYIENQLT